MHRIRRGESARCTYGTELLIIAAAATPAFGEVLHVDSSSPGGDGQSWSTAFSDLQSALLAASSDPEITAIWVASGTYTPTTPGGARYVSFQLLDGVSLLGGFAGGEGSAGQRDPDAHPTILSGDLNADDDGDLNRGDNSYHVVSGSGVDASAVLDGFVITGGQADSNGGGLLIMGGSPTIRGCTFVDNVANSRGGAVANMAGANPSFTDCLFDSNRTINGCGGAVFNHHTGPSFSRVRFVNNVANYTGGAVCTQGYVTPEFDSCEFQNNSGFWGGALSNEEGASPEITFCVFRANHAIGQGGAVSNDDDATPTISDSDFIENTAIRGAGITNFLNSGSTITRCTFEGNAADFGAAIAVQQSVLTLSDSVFRGNIAGDSGAGIYIGQSEATITNCNFEDNQADGGAGLYVIDAAPSLWGCRFAGNQAARGPAAQLQGAQPVFSRCDFFGNASTLEGGVVRSRRSDAVFQNCRMTGNTAGGSGGGIHAVEGSMVLINCVMDGNVSAWSGGAVYFQQGSLSVWNSTIAGNDAARVGGIAVGSGSQVSLLNTILWANLDDRGSGELAQIQGPGLNLEFCLVQGWTGELGGNGNSGGDPQFVDLDGADDQLATPDNDLHLSAGSAGIDAGSVAQLPPDTLDLDGDGDTVEPLPMDADDRPRVISGAVDLGAYESGELD